MSLSGFRSLTDQQQSNFLDPYFLSFQTVTRGAAIKALFEDPKETVAMVYSYHNEYGTNNGGRAEQLWHMIRKNYDHGNRMGAYSSSTPGQLCQLQAADLFAYELSHEFENRVKRPKDDMRWGLRQIMGMYRIPSPMVMLFDRIELLRITKESNFPDQTGTEELSDNQMQSAHKNMMRWLIERGQFTADRFSEFTEAIHAWKRAETPDQPS